MRELKFYKHYRSRFRRRRTSQEVRELKLISAPRERYPGICRTSQEVRELKWTDRVAAVVELEVAPRKRCVS